MKGMKKFLALIVASTISLTMISCGSRDNKEESKLSDSLNITTKYSDDVMKKISNEFKKETGITIKYTLKDEIIASDFKNTNADVIIGGPKELYIDMASKGMLAPYKTSWFDDVDNTYRDNDGNWYSIFKNPIVVVYNKSNLPASFIPRKLQDLESSKVSNKLVMTNSNDYYTKYFISATASYLTSINNNDENAGNLFLQNLKLNVASFYNDYDQVVEALNTKETPIGVLPLDILNKKIKSNPNLTKIDFPDGEPIVEECAGILKSTDHKNAADMFMEFIAGAKVQLELAKQFNIIPTLPIALKYSPDKIKEFKRMNVTEQVVVDNENKWIQYFNGVIKPVAVKSKTNLVSAVKSKKNNNFNKKTSYRH